MSTVVVVDDHPVFRRGLVGLLTASGHDVLGQARGGLEALEIVAEVRPQVVLMDLSMPDGDGFDATARITAEFPDTAVLVVTLFSDEASVARALRAGAAGYLGKHAEPQHLIAAVEAASAGALWIGSGIERPSFAHRPGSEPIALPGGLTARELVVADLLARGLANPAISARLGLSTKTVANYVSTILLKLGATDRADAARIIRTYIKP